MSAARVASRRRPCRLGKTLRGLQVGTWRRAAALLALGLSFSGCPKRSAHLPAEPHPEPERVGVTHRVRPGETLWRIARAYGLAPEEIALANQLVDPARLAAGQELFVPGARAVVELPALQPENAPPARLDLPSAREHRLGWPLIGVLYARFGPRGESRHDGIDIAAPLGTRVRAAADGVVVFSGEQSGYGHVVVLEHAGGLVTVYAHNSENLVKEGERVQASQPVAEVGQATRTSGPHLHFEVREGTVPKDPLLYLPPPR